MTSSEYQSMHKRHVDAVQAIVEFRRREGEVEPSVGAAYTALGNVLGFSNYSEFLRCHAAQRAEGMYDLEARLDALIGPYGYAIYRAMQVTNWWGDKNVVGDEDALAVEEQTKDN